MNMVVYFAPLECDGVLKFLCGNEMNAVDTTWYRLSIRGTRHSCRYFEELMDRLLVVYAMVGNSGY